jgi:thioredoxin 1
VLANHETSARFFWLDVEDEDELVGDIDIQTFPSLMIVDAGTVKFFGPVTTQPGVLTRVISSAFSSGAPAFSQQSGIEQLLKNLSSDPDHLAHLELKHSAA